MRVLPLVVLVALAACEREERASFEDPLHKHGIRLPPQEPGLPVKARAPESQVFPVPPPPFTPGIFPCSRCHEGGDAVPDDRPAMPHKKHLERDLACDDCHGKDPKVPQADSCFECHEERKVAARCETCHKETKEPQHRNVVLHHAEGHHCLDCHHETDRDYLRLASGQKVPFEESYRVCGQCHGPNLRDWKAGLHGKRTGMWDGEKTYFLCVHCHRDPHAPQFPPMKPDPPPARPEDIR